MQPLEPVRQQPVELTVNRALMLPEFWTVRDTVPLVDPGVQAAGCVKGRLAAAYLRMVVSHIEVQMLQMLPWSGCMLCCTACRSGLIDLLLADGGQGSVAAMSMCADGRLQMQHV